jgi:hypothetical protein
MQAKPAGYLANQPDGDGAFFASETIINDPGQSRFAGAALASDDVNFAGRKMDDARAVILIFGPENYF